MTLYGAILAAGWHSVSSFWQYKVYQHPNIVGERVAGIEIWELPTQSSLAHLKLDGGVIYSNTSDMA